MAACPPPLSPDIAVGSIVESRSLNAHFTRIVLDVPDVDQLNLPSAADTAVGIYFGEDTTAPGRTYTVRYDDTTGGRITVDVLMHGDGVGTAWARQAVRGDTVVLAHPNSWYRPPTTVDWQLLVTDMAGFPALARILDEKPAVPTTVVVDATDLSYLPQRSDVEIVPVSDGALRQQIAAYIEAHDGIGYCWFAGEAGEARAVRKYLRRERRWESDQLDVMGYWRRDAVDWNARYAAVGSDLYAVYTMARDAGKSEKDAMEEFDEALEEAGL